MIDKGYSSVVGRGYARADCVLVFSTSVLVLKTAGCTRSFLKTLVRRAGERNGGPTLRLRGVLRLERKHSNVTYLGLSKNTRCLVKFAQTRRMSPTTPILTLTLLHPPEEHPAAKETPQMLADLALLRKVEAPSLLTGDCAASVSSASRSSDSQPSATRSSNRSQMQETLWN